jgi:hypothetical protein
MPKNYINIGKNYKIDWKWTSVRCIRSVVVLRPSELHPKTRSLMKHLENKPNNSPRITQYGLVYDSLTRCLYSDVVRVLRHTFVREATDD